ncbi:MAG: hypothetical protein ACRD1B_11110 [Thermoanaerobaculia bacterium]
MSTNTKPVETVLELNQPVEALVEKKRPDENTAPARGIVIGIAASVAIWAAIIAALI